MPTRKEAESLWAASVMSQPVLWDKHVSKDRQAEAERIAMREAGIQLAFQLLNCK